MNIRMKKYQGFLIALFILTLAVFNACSDEKTSEQQQVILPNAEGYELRVLGIGQWAGRIEAVKNTITLDCVGGICSYSQKELPGDVYKVLDDTVVLTVSNTPNKLDVVCKVTDVTKPTKFVCSLGLGGAVAISKVWDDIQAEEKAKGTLRNLIKVSTGDNFGISAMVSARMNDVPTISLLNKIGLNYDTFGNHNLEKGIAYLQNLITLSKHNYVVANLTNVPQNLQKVAPYAMRYIHSEEKGSAPLLLAVVGTIDQAATSMIFSGSLGTVNIDDYCATKYAMQDAYNNGARAFLLLAHLAVDQNNHDYQTLYHFSKMLLEMKHEAFRICPERAGLDNEVAINHAIYESIVAVIGASARTDAAFIISDKNVTHLLTTGNILIDILRTSEGECSIRQAYKKPIDLETSWGQEYVFPDKCFDPNSSEAFVNFNLCFEPRATAFDKDIHTNNCALWHMYSQYTKDFNSKDPKTNSVLTRNELVEKIQLDARILKNVYGIVSQGIAADLAASALNICKKNLILDPDAEINGAACAARAENRFLPFDEKSLEIVNAAYDEVVNTQTQDTRLRLLTGKLSYGLDLLINAPSSAVACSNTGNLFSDKLCLTDMGNGEGNEAGFVFLQVTDNGQLLYDIKAKLKKAAKAGGKEDAMEHNYINHGLGISLKKPFDKEVDKLSPAACDDLLKDLPNCQTFYTHYINRKTESVPSNKERSVFNACFGEIKETSSVSDTVDVWRCMYTSTTSNICNKAFKEPMIFKFDKDIAGNTVSTDDEFALPYLQSNIRKQTTALGNLVCDAVIGYYQKAEGLEIAMINSGAIRDGLLANLTASKASKVCPYTNSIVVMKLTGRQVAEVLEYGLQYAQDVGAEHGSYLQVGGIRYSHEIARDKDKIRHIDLIKYAPDKEKNEMLREYKTIYTTDTSRCPNKECDKKTEKDGCLLKNDKNNSILEDDYCYYFDTVKDNGSGELGQTYALASLDYLYTGGDGFVFPEVPARILDVYNVAVTGYFLGTQVVSGCDNAKDYVTIDGLGYERLLNKLDEARASETANLPVLSNSNWPIK